ncbi:hypothetical protein H5410_054022, partial [Solanum commersonii]
EFIAFELKILRKQPLYLCDVMIRDFTVDPVKICSSLELGEFKNQFN